MCNKAYIFIDYKLLQLSEAVTQSLTVDVSYLKREISI